MATTKFKFGKIAFSNALRKNNPVEVEMELKENDKGQLVLSFMGSIYNSTKTDTIACGQIQDTINEYLSYNPLWRMIYELWQKYHLNDCHAGTVKQEEFLELWKARNDVQKLNYDTSCKLLEANNLLVDNGYKYGSSWLYREIPQEVLYLIGTLQKHF